MNFEEKLIERLKRLEREVERLQVWERPASGSGVTDHGLLTGLEDNDHPQYLLTTAQAADSDKLDGKTLAQVMLSIYPIGAIFMSSASTNPDTLFGGTWEAYGQGRVLVGKATSGTFATAGATGGSETHTLTEAEMPSHTHIQNAHSHTIPSSSSGADVSTVRPGGSTDTLTTSSTTATNQNTGGGEAHNNLQPYIVVYMWRRTG